MCICASASIVTENKVHRPIPSKCEPSQILNKALRVAQHSQVLVLTLQPYEWF